MEKIAILRWESGHVPQGLMQLEQLPGNSTNPASYPFPVKLVEVKGANTDTVILHPSQKLLEDMIQLAKELEKEGVSCEIIDLRTVFPYDKDTIQKSVAKTGRLVIAQEGVKCGGWAAEISAMINEDVFEYLRGPVKRVTGLDSPMPFSPDLEDYVMPQQDDVVKAIREVMEY